MDNNSNNTQTVDTLVLNKKLDNYGHNDDFVAPRELTVTITLSEYRDLVSAKSKADSSYSTLQQEKWKIEHERDDLKKKLETLTSLCPGLQQKEEEPHE
jgi:peptidoglycan hydrolase CwlO-like protein